jgi:hypothetical protein
VAGVRAFAAAFARPRDALAVELDEREHPRPVVLKLGGVGPDGCWKDLHQLPAAAVGLVPARRATPHGVHAEHLRAAAIAENALVGRRARRAGGRAAVR